MNYHIPKQVVSGIIKFLCFYFHMSNNDLIWLAINMHGCILFILSASSIS